MNTDTLTEQILELVAARMEPVQEAECVAAWAEANEGKRLSERNKPEGFHIVKRYGMTHLENEAYWRTRYQNALPTPEAMSFLVAHAETHVIIPSADELREKNPANFSAAVARNRKRAEMLADRDSARLVAAMLVQLRDAIANAQAALAGLPDSYAVKDLAGLGEVRIGRVSL